MRYSRSNRRWLALLYGLAIVLTQSAHDHRGGSEQPRAESEAGCDDPRPHLAGHHAPEIESRALDCPSCQFRNDHQGLPSGSEPLDEIRVSTGNRDQVVARRVMPRGPFFGRAPPSI